MKKYLVIMILALCLVISACGKKPAPEASEESAMPESSESIESSEEISEEPSEESSIEPEVEESEEEEPEEEESEEEEEPEEESSEEPEEESSEESEESSEEPAEPEHPEGVNLVYLEVAVEDEPDKALMVLYNNPDGELLYNVEISDTFNVAAFDQVMMIPRYEHSKIILWSLKTETGEDDQIIQVHDEKVFECKDATDRTVLFTSVERVEDAPRYALEIETDDHGKAEYIFEFNAKGNPPVEYITAESKKGSKKGK